MLQEKGWEGLALGRIQVHDVPGYHGELCREPYLRHWIDQLDACLDERRRNRNCPVERNDEWGTD